MEDNNSLNCSLLAQINNDFETEIELTFGQIRTLNATSNPSSTNPITTQDIKISNLGISFSKNCDSLKQSLIKVDSNLSNHLINQMHLDLNKLVSIFKIKFWPHRNLTPNFDIKHYEITALNNIMKSDCKEMIYLKVNSLQNKFLNNITQVLNRRRDFFNKFRTIAYADKTLLNKGDSLNLHVGFIGYDSTDFSHIQYWIDDSTKNPNSVENYYMKKPLSISGDKGKHTIYGNIRQFNAGFYFWKPWKFDFEVK